MTDGLVHTGDAYTDFQLLVQDTNVSGVTANLDISGATTLKMWFKDPDGNTTECTASFLTNGTDSLMRFINSSPGSAGYVNITTGGFWTYWGKLTFSGGGTFTTNPAIFEVLDNDE